MRIVHRSFKTGPSLYFTQIKNMTPTTPEDEWQDFPRVGFLSMREAVNCYKQIVVEPLGKKSGERIVQNHLNLEEE